ncbi:helix-turn-helix domain-containing protein [Chlamydiales bacterium]|nr:helix-turn-helix domain-containing protein [Chlamydiales bacterium]
MKKPLISEKFLIQEVTEYAGKTRQVARGLPIGSLIKSIRVLLGMSQKILAKRSGVPQSTISRIERGERDLNVSTLQKILSGMFCDLLIIPVLQDSIDTIRRIQAEKIAKKQIGYLKGTMNLEDQQPDTDFIKELLDHEIIQLLNGPNSSLWEE